MDSFLGGDMDECPHCGGHRIDIHCGYYRCRSDGCWRLLDSVGLEDKNVSKQSVYKQSTDGSNSEPYTQLFLESPDW